MFLILFKLCMCACVWAHVFRYRYVCTGVAAQRRQWMSLTLLLLYYYYFLSQGLLLYSELIDSGLPSQQAPGISCTLVLGLQAAGI